MTAKDIVADLNKFADAQTKKTWMTHGAKEICLGVMLTTHFVAGIASWCKYKVPGFRSSIATRKSLWRFLAPLRLIFKRRLNVSIDLEI